MNEKCSNGLFFVLIYFHCVYFHSHFTSSNAPHSVRVCEYECRCHKKEVGNKIWESYKRKFILFGVDNKRKARKEMNIWCGGDGGGRWKFNCNFCMNDDFMTLQWRRWKMYREASSSSYTSRRFPLKLLH